MSLSADEVVDALRAAGEPTRLRILALLAVEELSVMELGRILDQSQPRVSRHLKLMTEAGLIERFPDGAWVFYRLAQDGPRRGLIAAVLDRLKGPGPTNRDFQRLQTVREERAAAAAAYFERIAPRWDEVRSLYAPESRVEEALVRAAGPGPFDRVVDLGTGSGRMLALFATHAQSAVGLDLSQNMLNIARANVARAGLDRIELRHGDIFATGLPSASADLVVVHQVLHYLSDPATAVCEAARLVGSGGRLLIVDFAPHALEFLRSEHQHRRLGFSDEEMARWLGEAGLACAPAVALEPSGEGLTIKIWIGGRAKVAERSAA